MSKDKKQMMVLGVLALVIVAIGAFQFLGGKSSSAPVVENEGAVVQSDGDLIAMNSKEDDGPFGPWKPPDSGPFLSVLDKRDPFEPRAVIIEEPKPGQDEPIVKPPVNNSGPDLGDPEIGGGEDPYNPGPIDDLQTGRPLDEPPFEVAGIIQGSRSTMAILRPDDGPQLVVSVGDKIGKHLTIVAIRAKEVDVIYRGKNKTLSFRGGN